MASQKFLMTKQFFLVADNSHQIVSIKSSYIDAIGTSKLIPGGHIVEVAAKRAIDALSFAAKDHGYSPSPYLIEELGFSWQFTFHLVSTRNKQIIGVSYSKIDAIELSRVTPGSRTVEIVARGRMEACNIAMEEFGFEISPDLADELHDEFEEEGEEEAS